MCVWEGSGGGWTSASAVSHHGAVTTADIYFCLFMDGLLPSFLRLAEHSRK